MEAGGDIWGNFQLPISTSSVKTPLPEGEVDETQGPPLIDDKAITGESSAVLKEGLKEGGS